MDAKGPVLAFYKILSVRFLLLGCTYSLGLPTFPQLLSREKQRAPKESPLTQNSKEGGPQQPSLGPPLSPGFTETDNSERGGPPGGGVCLSPPLSESLQVRDSKRRGDRSCGGTRLCCSEASLLSFSLSALSLCRAPNTKTKGLRRPSLHLLSLCL